jgi:hypothetical protein
MNCRSHVLTIITLSVVPVSTARAPGPTIVPPLLETHGKHFLYGYPLGTPASNDVIVRDPYALSSNDTSKSADSVCGYLTTVDEVEKRTGLSFYWQLRSADPNPLRPGRGLKAG